MKTGKFKIAIIGSLAMLCFVCVAATVVNSEDELNNTGLADKQAADSSLLKVVVSEISERPYEDWGSYSAELRGGEDASLSAPFQGGRVNDLAPVGARVRAGQALCDIDSVRLVGPSAPATKRGCAGVRSVHSRHACFARRAASRFISYARCSSP